MNFKLYYLYFISSSFFPVHGEYLLVFQTLAIYVDLQGRKSRDREIMYPAVPKHISKCLNSSTTMTHQ